MDYISHFSKINLVIQGIGNQDLLYSGFMPGPSEVYVNGISQNGTCDKKCFLEEEISNITLVFEEKLTTCNSMFYKLNNIKEIDLSEFDASSVTNMASMLSECGKLQRVIFGNINTSSVRNMNNLFSNSYNLESLDLSHFDTSSVTDMMCMFMNCSALKEIDVSSFSHLNYLLK